jgi:hypothetical protein
MMQRFFLKEGVSTIQVNRAVRAAQVKFLDRWYVPNSLRQTNERRRHKGTTYYVFGIGNDLRDTLVAHFEPGTGRIDLCFPNDYKGWDRANSYDRLRISIRDEIVYKSGIVDTSRESVTL